MRFTSLLTWCFSLAVSASAAPAVELANRGGWRNWMREATVESEDTAQFGLTVPKIDDAAKGPIVIVIHGFNSAPDRCQALMKVACKEGALCGAFAYPNDYHVAWGAEQLSHDLKQLARRMPERRVALVTHSMGGLVARACIEDPALDPGNVSKLVMIAPPSTGSRCAEYAAGADLWEHWLRRKEGSPWRRMRDSVVDGLGEAGDDLAPNSAFLTALNARPRNPHVQYTILLGSGGCVSDEEVLWVRRRMRGALAYSPVSNEGIDELDKCLADFEEIVEGKGDGLVAIKRGRLEGVADTHVLPFSHVAVADDTDDPVTCRVQRMIAERIAAE
jgi:pimeloyl-ACP methyl ester carboxylesterase